MAPLLWKARNLRHRARGWKAELANIAKLGVLAQLHAQRFRAEVAWEIARTQAPQLLPLVAEAIERGGDMLARLVEVYPVLQPCATDYGLVSRRVVTNNGVAFMVDAFQNLVEMEAMNWHASGTGSAAEAAADAALGAEVASRVNGTQSEPASNQYRTVATISYSSTLAIAEHGVFSANAAGTLLDRSVFTVINVGNGDSIQFTYTMTLTAGG